MEMSQDTAEAIQLKISTFKSRRLKIVHALIETLKTITCENGYTQDTKDVTIDVKGWQDKLAQQCPCIFVVDDIVSIVRRVGKQREYTWTIKLFGVTKEMSFEAFEEYIADIEECLEDNNHLCGAASKCEINQVITDNQMFQNNDIRLFEMDIQVEYIRCLGNPR